MIKSSNRQSESVAEHEIGVSVSRCLGVSVSRALAAVFSSLTRMRRLLIASRRDRENQEKSNRSLLFCWHFAYFATEAPHSHTFILMPCHALSCSVVWIWSAPVPLLHPCHRTANECMCVCAIVTETDTKWYNGYNSSPWVALFPVQPVCTASSLCESRNSKATSPLKIHCFLTPVKSNLNPPHGMFGISLSFLSFSIALKKTKRWIHVNSCEFGFLFPLCDIGSLDIHVPFFSLDFCKFLETRLFAALQHGAFAGGKRLGEHVKAKAWTTKKSQEKKKRKKWTRKDLKQV